MPSSREAINLRKIDLKEMPPLYDASDRIAPKDTFDSVFGELPKGEELIPQEWNRRLRGIIAYRFMRQKASVKNVIECWDEMTDPKNSQSHDDPGEALKRQENLAQRNHLESIIGTKLTTRERFFHILKYRINGAIKIGETAEEQRTSRRLRVDETHDALKMFDATIAEINGQIRPESRLNLETRIENSPGEIRVESLPQPHTVAFGRCWWYEPEVPVTDKSTRLDQAAIKEEVAKLERLRVRISREREVIASRRESIIDNYITRRRKTSPAPLTDEQVEALREVRGDELDAERDRLAKMVEPGDRGIIERALMMVREERINAMWALEWARDSIVEEIDREIKADPIMGSILITQKPDYFEAGITAMLRLAGKRPEQLAREALGNMRPQTIPFSPKTLGVGSLTQFAESLSIEATTVGDRSDLGRHKGNVFMERGKVLAHIRDMRDYPEETGDHVIIDTFTSGRPRVIINPTEETREYYLKQRDIALKLEAMKREESVLEAETPKKEESSRSVMVQLSGNIAREEDVDSFLEHGAKGAGLVRSEEIILKLDRLPSFERIQKMVADVYRRIGRKFEKSKPEKSGYPVICRTFDVGGDKYEPCLEPIFEGVDPADYRGMDVLLDHPALFKANIKGFLEAARDVPTLEIMLPMVSDPEQVDAAMGIWSEGEAELNQAGARYRTTTRFGAMIETVRAVMNAPKIVDHGAQFLGVGTNDLSCDRFDITMDKFKTGYHDHDPSVLRLLNRLIKSLPQGFRDADPRTEKNLPLEVCGDMAGTVTGAILLVGMGYRKLSMVGNQIPLVKRVIRDTPIEVMESITREAVEKDTIDEVRTVVKDRMLQAGIDIASDRYNL